MNFIIYLESINSVQDGKVASNIFIVGGKTMKKQLFFSIILYALPVHGHELQEQKIFRRIVSNHTRAFDNENMYAQPLNRHNLEGWDNSLMLMHDFVHNNSKKEKKYLLRCFSDIHKANTILINRIEKIYTQYQSGSCDAAMCKKFTQKFEAIAHKMRLIQKSLDWVASRRAKENQAIRFVQMAAQFVGATARKAALNLTA